MKNIRILHTYAVLFLCTFFFFNTLSAQTDQDAIMMAKNNFCTGLTYDHSSWKDYWEGTFKRNNANLGTVSTNSFSVMGNYGIKGNLNLLVGLPYVETKASAGTLHGMKGLQDLSLWLKWMPIEKKLGKGVIALYTIGGASIPASNYTTDFLPMSIGSGSKTVSGRILVDYQLGHFFVTGGYTYTLRSDINISRTAYYTTELILSNKVNMPDMDALTLRTGYRSGRLIAEAVISDMKTLGGFDIRKNDMPFPSNTMNATSIAANFKYTFQKIDGLAIIGGANTVIAGRNVGQATGFDIGAFYVFDFSPKSKKK